MLIRLLIPLAFCSFLAGCATVEGVGEDVATVGEAIQQDAAQAR